MKKAYLLLAVAVVAIVAILLVVSLSNPNDNQLAGETKLRLQLQWFHGPQFAGFYVALENNYFGDENLEVEILQGGFAVNPIQKVLISDEADIGIATADQVLLARSKGHAIKAVGTVYNTSLACFMSKASSNIRSPQDFVGQTVGVYAGFDTESILRSLLDRHKVEPSDVDIVLAADIQAFVNDEIDSFPSYLHNEPVTMAQKNIPVTVMIPDDFGVEFYSDTVFLEEQYWSQNKDVVERFLRAAAKGWEYARDHPEETIAIINRQIGPPATAEDAEHRRRSLDVCLQHIGAGNDDHVFVMERTRWQSMESSLKSIGELEREGYVGQLCDFNIAAEAQD